MSGARLTAEVDLSGARKTLEAVRNGFDDFTQPLERCAFHGMQEAGNTFRLQGRPTAWAALSPVTLALRPGGGGGGQILRDTGRLMMSVTKANEGKEGAIWRLSKNLVEFGTNLLYAGLQQFGGTVQVKKARVLCRQLKSESYVPRVSKLRKVSGKKGGTRWVIFGKKVTIKPRPFLVLRDEDIKAFTRILAEWTTETIRRIQRGP